MILYDIHTHSSFSDDSAEAPENQIERAIELGLSGICLTDHMDYLYPKYPGEYSFFLDVKGYTERMLELKERYSDRIRLLIGIELGLRNERDIRDEVRDFYEELLNYPFDFVIGSTHVSRHYDPYYAEWWKGLSKEEGMREFFTAILENTEFYSNYDTCAHLDYISRYWPGEDRSYDPLVYMDIFDEILKKLIADGKALECNTSGYKYGLERTHPANLILKRYRELGGEMITIGSDAHKSQHIAFSFDRAEEMLKDIGFRYYTVFEGRKPVMIKF